MTDIARGAATTRKTVAVFRCAATGAALPLRDDLDDCTASAAERGNPVGRDRDLGERDAARRDTADPGRPSQRLQ